ncbi:GNAT family N-acetyltransferase [Actinoallomurus spadix]|uniref:N-acetyltransferase domain-containing protein n=1 Tax=Actinoallomurus spadix TaxID=79912 RepID=A0ABP3GJK6_9ACTN|nr:GNAT family N-acetyltransferase [Actinoallomurus spadix]MCO5986478.1 GNAT family N-acetyltransferase [Actinoallomurus spadix]
MDNDEPKRPDVTVIEVPQWQGSSSPAAHRLRAGARLLAGLLPTADRRTVDVADEAGAAALAGNARRIRAVLERADGRFTVTLGGDCGVELEPIAAAARRYGDRLTVVWFDAHGDLNTPASSPSGAFHGMVLRTLLGDGPVGLVPDRPLKPSQVVLAGVRDLDPAEHDYAAAAGIPTAGDPDALVEAVGDASAVYVHIDLDVLDPSVFRSVGLPTPGGLTPDRLLAMVTALARRFEVAGLGITEYEPARPEDQDLLAGLVRPIVDVCRSSVAGLVEPRARAAWPAEVTEERGGWLLRHTAGVRRRRSNSAVPPPAGAEKAVREVEHFYRERSRPVIVQIPDGVDDGFDRLDALLDRRGYRLDAPTAVLTAFTEDVVAATEDAAAPVEVAATPETWLPVFGELSPSADAEAVGSQVISRIAAPAGFATTTRDGGPAGLGLFVADTGWAGVFCMAVRPEHRRQGLAAAVLGAGARWAARQGAHRMYLQVETDNDAAWRLYAKTGFTRSYAYHYRIAP